MTFDTEKEAYDFHNSYARSVGFSIRKCHTKMRADGTLCCKYFVCSNEGQPAAKQRASTRSDCKARVQFNISREGIWTVQKVELDHNHFLVSPDKAHMLRSQRRLLESDQQIMSQMRKKGITTADIRRVLQQGSAGAENVHLLKKDSEKKYLQPSYAQALLEYLKNKQSENPSFFYAVQLDDDGRIANFFWTDGQAIVDYACFGDVVSFDTTFKRNRSEMPFSPFVGTNHHKQTIIFGAALIYDEFSESFPWLFQTFLTAMSGKQPATIFTDQSSEISKAIGLVFSNSSHCLCLRHICHNVVKHLSNGICNHPQFLSDFKKCVYEKRSIVCFDLKWKELVSAYNLQGNTWMKNLSALREKWAAVYCHDSFYADMISIQNNES
ncbi:protein FAR1-RELATED SEQUENCE 5-like [Phragmites australis]|uniref:protein FAR1-RELATED SEQUENCE 5-like n=1 Tax=Phragmites australis TaxID=29695 RepID=UPI002D79712B|nr:protein FAR1-RELATED SEQUENCE 5-like [Phragmites australis]